ncbi:hypothetical protein BGZ68_003125, partial [Mortierella alpina]
TDTIELGKKIGSGAQAEIFKAKCGLDEVVVKRFLDSKHKSTKQEVAIIQDLTHKHIVQFYHVHHAMIVMEYVEGGNLAEAIVEKALKSWEVKVQIAKGVSLGLAYLHCQGIIHCDIKSSNILLTEHKEAKICDFGLAMRVGESGGGGTLQWMAPELLQIPPEYTSKSDVYALGMVMWEMASESTRPYREHTPDGVMYCILNGILEVYPDNTPQAYAACIQTCWMLDPDKRPAAMDMPLDIVQTADEQNAPEQRHRSATNKGKMDHYLKALEKSFKTNEFAGFTEILKSRGMTGDDKTMDWFDSSAGGGESAKAMFKMGTMYYYGRGVQSDYGEALEWYLAASEAGIAVAMLKISQMYQYGCGVDQDDKEAASWYCKGEETLNEQGKLNNRIVHHDAGVSEHHRETMEWFSNTEDNGLATVKLNIGAMYYDGQDLNRDYDKALTWYLKASEDGYNSAMFKIGNMYCNGLGIEQDYGMALEWYLKASDAGNASAMVNIGFLYENGLGVGQNFGEALKWNLKASDAGVASAMYNIGNMYYKGHGIEQDYGKVQKWYLKASDAGYASAMVNIGYMYENGLGVEQDYGKALEWNIKARDAGHASATVNIGFLYKKGLPVAKDYGKALEWSLKASDAGVASAMFNIGN